MSLRREIKTAVAERCRLGNRFEKGRIPDELCAVTGWHRKHAIRSLARNGLTKSGEPGWRSSIHGAAIKDALIALWEASGRVCRERLKAMIPVMNPVLLPALERRGRLSPTAGQRALIASMSAATIDRTLAGVKIVAAGGRRPARRAAHSRSKSRARGPTRKMIGHSSNKSQIFVEQMNGAMVRRIVGYGRFDDIETAKVMARRDAAARLHVNLFQPPSRRRKSGQAEGKAPRKRECDQAPSHTGDAVPARIGTSEVVEGHQAETARDLSQPRSGGAVSRYACGSAGTRSMHRQALPYRRCGRRFASRRFASRPACLRADARYGG